MKMTLAGTCPHCTRTVSLTVSGNVWPVSAFPYMREIFCPLCGEKTVLFQKGLEPKLA